MINSKLEKLFIVIIWYLILIIYALIILPTEFIGIEKSKVCIIAATLFTMLIYYLYCRKRNNNIYKKIHSFLTLNKYDECISYIENCLKKNKKIIWLHFEKAIVLGLKGAIIDFRSYANELKNAKYSGKKNLKNYNRIFMMEQIFAYLVNGETPTYDLKSRETHLEKTLWLLANMEKMESKLVIETAYDIYNSTLPLFKSIISLILYKEYNKIDDNVNSRLFALKAKENAPSDEVMTCITEHLAKETDMMNDTGH